MTPIHFQAVQELNSKRFLWKNREKDMTLCLVIAHALSTEYDKRRAQSLHSKSVLLLKFSSMYFSKFVRLLNFVSSA